MAGALAIAIQLAMALMVFCFALGATLADVTALFRRPILLAKSLLAMNVAMPVLAVAAAVAFDLHPAVEIAMVASALSPVPPIVPGKEIEAGGSKAYVLSLLVTVALVAIVFVPVVATAIGHAFARPVRVSAGDVARIVGTSILAPIVAGLVVRHFWPALAGRLGRPLSIVANVVLVGACIPVLIGVWPAVVALVGNYSFVALAAFAVVGLAVGHILGGPVEDNRTVLALSTSSRHPAVALAIAHAAQDPHAVAAAVLVLLVLGVVVSIPYVRWRRRVHAAAQAR